MKDTKITTVNEETSGGSYKYRELIPMEVKI